MDFPGCSVVKNLPAKAGDTGDTGSIPGLGRFPREGHGSPLQYSCLENPMDRGAWWATIHGVTRVRHNLVTEHTCIHYVIWPLIPWARNCVSEQDKQTSPSSWSVWYMGWSAYSRGWDSANMAKVFTEDVLTSQWIPCIAQQSRKTNQKLQQWKNPEQITLLPWQPRDRECMGRDISGQWVSTLIF